MVPIVANNILLFKTCVCLGSLNSSPITIPDASIRLTPILANKDGHCMGSSGTRFQTIVNGPVLDHLINYGQKC